MINKVRLDEKISPHTIAVATGDQTSECPPTPNDSDNRPATVVNVVIMIGNILLLAA